MFEYLKNLVTGRTVAVQMNLSPSAFTSLKTFFTETIDTLEANGALVDSVEFGTEDDTYIKYESRTVLASNKAGMALMTLIGDFADER